MPIVRYHLPLGVMLSEKPINRPRVASKQLKEWEPW